MIKNNKNNITKNLFEYDLSFKKQVGGCDEAGRGSLAGPLVCASVIMPLDYMIEGIDDSKKISEKNREILFEKIIECAISVRVSVINNDIIDEINILNATKQAMLDSIDNLSVKPEMMLIDAVDLKRSYKAIIKGDSTSYNIASASIVAKVTRDKIMKDYDKLYPQYNFKQNKGYQTNQHITALREFGVTPIHRITYLKNFFERIKNEQMG